MSAFGKLRAIVTGRVPGDAQQVFENLQAASIPVTSADCRNCADPCEDHDDFSKRIDVNMDSDMLGSVKPYRRQVLVSTRKSDWEREVTSAYGTLAYYLSEADSALGKGHKHKRKGGGSGIPGVFAQDEATRLSILNASHKTFCDDHTQESVIVLPDFKVVAGVPHSLPGAEQLWKTALDPDCRRAGSKQEASELKSWILPYSCLILLCSHKRRDKRCHISAPILEKTFVQYLEKEGWEAHTQLEDLSHTPSIEDTDSDEAALEEQLKAHQSEHRVLIIKSSHIGGHKFAGNCIIYTPRGASVWYGRVTPHDVESIVQNTIVLGQILAPLLRGGLDLAKPGCNSIYQW
ncbi:hypothetical protein CONPUDRAFT_103206 [Coniophora puteana RWD-64-598 SS2]|uniref:Sucraseferredoxin-like protein n=1 Tax=Coniophora puteana (strain RWD-64-598) TaxID=741705 RepID=A0A5M3MT41_CONPW|nr:uncharacterized protein CONPUDRAFT_103206 [Coniophora puteana RWD-64-598 SS2]EIW82256.1 hypothetical protein CONPUDRAFT_103206 [Coniophora puteana RWD-64-598 SS2]